MKKNLVIVFAVLASSFLAAPEAFANSWNEDASYTFRATNFMTPGTIYPIETTNLSPGADTVIHILHNGTEYAYADGCGQEIARSCLNFNPPFPASYTILVRAYSSYYAGSADVRVQGILYWSNVAVGGDLRALSQLRVNDVLQAALLPGGSTDTYLYLICSRFLGGPIVEHDDDGGVGWASRIVYSPDAGCIDPAVLVSTYGPSHNGTTHLMHNDLSAGDADSDGLGPMLERALGTCSTLADVLPNGFNCAIIADAKDSDGDRIQDDREALGYDAPSLVSLEFPKWGANPAHKDLFIEADWCRGTCSLTDATYLDDEDDEIWVGVDVFAGGADSYLKNPDKQPGIAVHVDNGLAPSISTDTSHGAWGGANCIPENSQECQKDNQGLARTNYMSADRRGMFEYYRVDCNGNCGGTSGVLDDVASGGSGGLTWAHEVGHSLGLRHDGAHSAGEANCKPNYHSIMNYAYNFYYDSFSSGEYMSASLDRYHVNEVTGLNTGTSANIAFLQNLPYKYLLSPSGGVDWNRDGNFANQVKANLTWAWSGQSCYTGTYQITHLDTTNSPGHSPQMANIHSDTSGKSYRYVFWPENGSYYYSRAWSLVDCQQPPCDNPEFDATRLLLGAGGSAVTVETYAFGGQHVIIIADCDADGKIWTRFMTLQPDDTESFSSWAALTDTGACIDSPEMISHMANGTHEDGIFLYYVTSSHNVETYHLDIQDLETLSWVHIGKVTMSGGSDIVSKAAMTVTTKTTQTCGSSACIYAAYAGNSNSQVHVIKYNPGTNNWDSYDTIFNGTTITSNDKVAFVWNKWSEHSTGRFWLGWRPTVSDLPRLTFTDRDGLFGSHSYWNAYHTHTLQGLDFLRDGDKIRAADVDAVDNTVRFWQNMDGLLPYMLSDFNDWSEMRYGICMHFSDAENPIACLAHAAMASGMPQGFVQAAEDRAANRESDDSVDPPFEP